MIKNAGEVQAAENASILNKPLISILCRTINRPELEYALRSAIDQTYEPLEILLVDATGKKEILSRNLPARSHIRLLTPDDALDRPRAANFALDHARGEYLLFLDEDDWIATDHVKLLADSLHRNSTRLAAYSATQKVDSGGKPLGILFNHSYDPVLLQRDNYIPIHSVLFSRKLIGLGCRFDESLEIYEDWDFWLQCARHTEFYFLDRVTAFYRQGGESQTSPSSEGSKYDNNSHLGAMRAKIFEKWLPTWDGKTINAMLGTMDQSKYIASLSEHIVLLEQQIAALSEVNEAFHHYRIQARQKEVDLQAILEAQHAKIEELSNILQNLIHSSSWQLTKPYRWIGHRLKLFVLTPLRKLLSRH